MSQVRAQTTITMKTMNTSSPAYRIVTPATGAANTVMVWDTSTCLMLGASVSEHSATGEAWEIAIAGTCKLQAGDNISVGSIVTAQTATGKAIAGVKDFTQSTTSVTRTFGVALEGISTSALGEVLINICNISMTKV